MFGSKHLDIFLLVFTLEELITVQHLSEVLQGRRKNNFVDDPKVLNKSASSFGAFPGSTR